MLIQVNGDVIKVEHISLITKGTSSKILPSPQTGLGGFAQCIFEIHFSSKKIIQIRKSIQSNTVCILEAFIDGFNSKKEMLIMAINGISNSDCNEFEFKITKIDF